MENINIGDTVLGVIIWNDDSGCYIEVPGYHGYHSVLDSRDQYESDIIKHFSVDSMYYMKIVNIDFFANSSPCRFTLKLNLL